MNNTINHQHLNIISIILRAAMASLFLGTALIKFPGGVSGVVEYYMGLFEGGMLPAFLVKIHASIIMFVEFAMAIWLISGYRLKWAWVAASGVLISLAFGMIFVAKFDVVSDNYIYVVISALGLFLSQYDRLQWGNSVTTEENVSQ